MGKTPKHASRSTHADANALAMAMHYLADHELILAPQWSIDIQRFNGERWYVLHQGRNEYRTNKADNIIEKLWRADACVDWRRARLVEGTLVYAE